MKLVEDTDNRTSKNANRTRTVGWSPIGVTLLYLAGGAIWVLFSDLALSQLQLDPKSVASIKLNMGWGFVVVTGGFLFWLARLVKTKLDTEAAARFTSEDDLVENEQKFRSVINASGMTAIIAIDAAGLVTTWNIGATQAFGYTEQDMLNQPLTRIIPQRYRDAHNAGLKRAMESTDNHQQRPVGKAIELHGLHKNGHEFPIEVSLGVWEFNDQKYFSAVISDITLRMESDEKIYQLAYLDPATGYPNDAMFHKFLSEQLEHAENGFVAMIELTGTGEIIGTFGLEALELIIYETARKLTDQVNDLSLVARTGERMYKVLYIPDDPIMSIDPRVVVDRLYQSVCASFDLMGSNVAIQCHMSVCLIDAESTTPQLVLTNNEIAHYESMSLVGGGVVYYNPEIKHKLVRNTQIISWLHEAIADHSFQLFFQPQIDVKTNTIIGCEALIRWPFKPQEWISPGEFIPIAEKSGQIGEITLWTVGEACRTAANWMQKEGMEIRMAVNISAEELGSENFTQYVSKFLESTQLPPELLEVEITETALMKDVSTALMNLKKLRALGVTIAIDDFGTGQSSLAYLKSFPIDRLKIDQSFVFGAPNDKTDQEIISSIITLAHSLGMVVIAEGAEEKAHVELLESLSCDEIQGYYYAKPMPVAEFIDFAKSFKSKSKMASGG